MILGLEEGNECKTPAEKREKKRTMINPLNFIPTLLITLIIFAIPVITYISFNDNWNKVIQIILCIISFLDIGCVFNFNLTLITTSVVRVSKKGML